MTYAVPGSFMEVVSLDPNSSLADGSTSVFQVKQAHAPDAAGAYLEVAFLGSSNAMRAQYIDGLMQRGALVHLCAAFCEADTTTRRPVIHVPQVRLRQPQDLTGPWMTPNPALAAMQAAMGAFRLPCPRARLRLLVLLQPRPPQQVLVLVLAAVQLLERRPRPPLLRFRRALPTRRLPRRPCLGRSTNASCSSFSRKRGRARPQAECKRRSCAVSNGT